MTDLQLKPIEMGLDYKSVPGVGGDTACLLSGMERPCSVDQCDGLAGARGTARGLCAKHYYRLNRYGDPLGSAPVLVRQRKVAECDSTLPGGLGFCNKHYMRLRTHGSLDLEEKPASYSVVSSYAEQGWRARCRFEDCTNIVSRSGARGWCPTHYQRFRKHGDPAIVLASWTTYEPPVRSPKPRQEPRIKKEICTVEGCFSPQWRNTWCNKHQQRVWRHGSTDALRRYVRDTPEMAQERAKQRGRDRKARIRSTAVVWPISIEGWAAKVAYWGDRCWMCGEDWTSQDHVKPLSRGGLHVLANLRPACTSCNTSKHSRWNGPKQLREFVKSNA